MIKVYRLNGSNQPIKQVRRCVPKFSKRIPIREMTQKQIVALIERGKKL